MSTENPRVLVIDAGQEDSSNTGNLRRVLLRLRLRVLAFSEWKPAKEELGQAGEGFDLVLLNPTVPGYSASEFREVLRARPRGKEPRLILLGPEDIEAKWYLPAPPTFAARIEPTHTPSDVAYICRRVLYRGSMFEREYPRALVHFQVDFVCGEERRRRQGTTLNLSNGGLFLLTDELPEIRQLIDLTLHLPDGDEPIECTGKVVYRREPDEVAPAGVGIQFKGINDVDVYRIRSYVRPRVLPIDQQAVEGFRVEPK